MFKKIYIILSLMLIMSCKSQQELPTALHEDSFRNAKNIILLIGDGMGMGQITAGTYANDNYSHLERFPYTGLHKPHASDSLVTDSASGASAFATGEKTYYGAISVSTDSLPLYTILEEAEERDLKTGLVSTSTIVHATPAAFIAHATSRVHYEQIAADFLSTDIDYFVGGGKKYFDRRENDTRDLVSELKSKNYTVTNYLEDFEDLEEEMNKAEKFVWFSADKHPLSVDQGRTYLPDAALQGLDFLNRDNENGFFIMIESAQIDWGGHANNEKWIIDEFEEFNRIIGEVLDWAEKDGETLVIVTADHETGGFSIQPGSTMDSLVTAFTSTTHTGDFIPVFAFGPGSWLFTGLYDNTQIYHKMRKAYGWRELKIKK